MMKRFLLKLILVLTSVNVFSQVAIRDKWDTLIGAVTYTYPVQEEWSFNNSRNVVIGNKIYMFGDSVHEIYSYRSSYLQVFNSSSNSLDVVNYKRTILDGGITGVASVTTNTANLSYIFFSPNQNSSLNIDTTVLYKLNTLTQAVTSETLGFTSVNYHPGILNIAAYSPTTNNDSLVVFLGEEYGLDTVRIFRKHYNQIGFVNTHEKLPVNLNSISSVFVFNNVLFVAGRQGGFYYLLRSTDGIHFTEVSNYTSNYNAAGVVEMDTLNNEMYLGLLESDGYYSIIKTSDGVNFTDLIIAEQGFLNSLKKFRNQIWYTVKEYVPNIAPPQDQKIINPINVMDASLEERPSVFYLSGPSYSIHTLSVDTIGRPFNYADSYRLNVLNNRLLLAGNMNNYDDYVFGTFVYEFIPPVAQFSVSSTNWCLNNTYTLVSQSLNADSVRWIRDNNFYYSTSNSAVFAFTTAGNHIVGLIAISGTQKDTLKYTINVYGVNASVAAITNGCQNVVSNITPTISGAIVPANYNWVLGSGLNAPVLTTSAISITAPSPGTFSYYLQVTDANNCQGISNTGSISVNGSKSIVGVASTTASVVDDGEIVIYRHVPFNTKFDSVTYVSLNTSGSYTLANIDAGTYLIHCVPTALSLQATYAPSAIGWKNATVITHGCDNNLTQNISVLALANIGTGPGILSGKVVEGVGYGNRTAGSAAPGNPIKGLTIKGGRNPGGDVSAQARTNAAGEYTLSGFPVDVIGESYFVLVDIPGLDTNATYHRAIITGSVVYTDLDFVVDSTMIHPATNVFLQQLVNISSSSVRLFPNPTNGLLNVSFSLNKEASVAIEVYDIMGKLKLIHAPLQFMRGKEHHVQLGVNEFTPGVYILNLLIGNEVRTIRFVVTE